MLGATISTNFPWEVYLGKLCMMHVQAQRRTMQATSHTSLRARPCARGRSWDGAACVGQGSILADPTRLTNAIDIRQRYPNCFLREYLLVILTSTFLHIFRRSPVPSGFLDRIREVSTVSRYVLHSAAADMQQPLGFTVKYFYASHFIAAGLE